jgi:two-component system chemotaxis sensor kinase CheA
MDDQKHLFLEEAYELLGELETGLLELEGNPTDKTVIARVFRAMHTIKGSGAMFGFLDIAEFTHQIESVYDLVREGRMAVTAELINLSLEARDQIRSMLDASIGDATVDMAAVARIRDDFESLLVMAEQGGADRDAQPVAKKRQEADKSSSESAKEGCCTYRIRFRPQKELFRSGTNPVLLLDELRELGACTIVAHTETIPMLDSVEPDSCYVSWDVILTTDKGTDAILDVFIFVEHLCDLDVKCINAGTFTEDEAGIKRVGEILLERGDITNDVLTDLLQKQKKIGELLVEAGAISRDTLASVLAEQKHLKEVRAKSQQEERSSSIRVDAARLDGLVNLVGELVTVQARLSQRALLGKDSDLLAIAEEIERLTAELRDNTMGIRMMPIGTLFSKFRRLVRDLSRDLNKEVVMVTEGEETELDKTVIEKLNDPFVHLIRNSIDHGIEMPEERAAAGKPAQGTLHLSAIHSGDSVIIEIKDDGAGLNREVLRRKAIEKGLLREQDDLSDQEVYQLLFQPGFSTAKTVSNISGRGVGMDVVKRGIESLRGSISLDTVPGQETTVRIRLPLTLAIIESLLVKIGETGFVMPLGSVEECIELTREDVNKTHGRNMISVRGHVVPFISLREQFAIEGELPAIEQIVITSVNDTRIGFAVDYVVGEHQTVIKSLGPMHRNVRGVSGATILGDGSVALILDIAELVQDARDQGC